MAGKKKDEAVEALYVELVKRGSAMVHLLGTSPMFCHRLSPKAQMELILPKVRTKGGRQGTLKHDPLVEYRESCYLAPLGADFPTRIMFKAAGVKAAMADVATDLPGVAKAAIARLTYVEGEYVPIWGVPMIHICEVRSADINRTPDMRTRAILPQWAAAVRVTWVEPNVNHGTIVNLLANAGIMRGLGDWRPQKGKGSFGQFEVVQPDDPRLVALMQSGGAEAQDAALDEPQAYNEETRDLLARFENEVTRRNLGHLRVVA